MTASPDASIISGDSSIPYATPVRQPGRSGPKVWAAVATLLAALGLVGLGGCFLMGVMGVVQPEAINGNPIPPPQSLTGPQAGLVGVLYVMTFLCVSGAAAVGFVAIKWLRSIVKQ